jgi:hypothetical protein
MASVHETGLAWCGWGDVMIEEGGRCHPLIERSACLSDGPGFGSRRVHGLVSSPPSTRAFSNPVRAGGSLTFWLLFPVSYGAIFDRMGILFLRGKRKAQNSASKNDLKSQKLLTRASLTVPLSSSSWRQLTRAEVRILHLVATAL